MSDLLDHLDSAALDSLQRDALMISGDHPRLASWLTTATTTETRRRAGEDLPAPTVPLIEDKAEREAVMLACYHLVLTYEAGAGARETLVPCPRFPEEYLPTAQVVHDFYCSLAQLVSEAARPGAGEGTH